MEIPECNLLWIKKEPEELENVDVDHSVDSVDPLAVKPEEKEEDVEVQPIETVKLESYIGNENDSDGLEEDNGNIHFNRIESEEEEEAQEERGVVEEEEEEEEEEENVAADNPDCTVLDILYPKILIENDKPVELKEETEDVQINEENHPLATSGAGIDSPQCQMLVTSGDSELDVHRETYSVVPGPVHKLTPLIQYPEFCDRKNANPNAVPRQRIRSKNKPKRQQTAALFEIRDGLYWCTQCNYKTASDGGLRHHRRAHQEKLESFKCGFCDYGCSRSRDLERHLRTHTGEKPYKCEICGYTCSSLSNLKRHTMRHTGELPYACSVCEFRCARSGTLEIHERTHNKLKPYQCSLCSRAFAAASSLKRHEGMHAEVGHLVCEHCDYRCGQMHLLKRHMKRHERDGIVLRHASRHAKSHDLDLSAVHNLRHAERHASSHDLDLRHASSHDLDLSAVHGLRHAERHASSLDLDLSVVRDQQNSTAV